MITSEIDIFTDTGKNKVKFHRSDIIPKKNTKYAVSVSPSAKIVYWRMLVSSIPLCLWW
jgi:hypothetical protein